MPRSPLITQAVRRLSTYFGATTTSEYIAKSRLIATAQASNDPSTLGSADTAAKLSGYQKVLDAGGTDVSVGISFEDELAELIFGSRGIYYFEQSTQQLVSENNLPSDASRRNQVEIFGYNNEWPSGIFNNDDVSSYKDRNINKNVANPTKSSPNLYAVNVNNPFLGPAVRDVGGLQIFLNGIPNVEFSKCVPYVDIDIITPRPALGPDNQTMGEGITLLKFLKPTDLSDVDREMLKAQNVGVTTEAGAVTRGGAPLFGAKSSMEMFTSPATLSNMDSAGPIDRFRPPMSLGQLQVSNKLRPAGGGLSFSTARLEIVIHDRSRLRDFVDFVRPDLYGLTFMDITYGWSHIDGGINSNNVYGTLLDALKVKQRYRIINSSYTFDEVGQVKVSLSLATVGSTDLLFLRMRGNTSIYNQLEKIARQLSSMMQEYQRLPKTPSLSKIDTIAQFTDPNSILSAADDQGVLQQISDAIKSNSIPYAARNALASAYGNVEKKGKDDTYEIGEGSLVARYKEAMKKTYSDIVAGLLTASKDPFANNLKVPDANGTIRFDQMGAAVGKSGFRPGALFTPSEATSGLDSMDAPLTVDDYAQIITDQKGTDEFVTLGSIFYNIIGAQLAKSNIYDEVQIVFYPFNKHAGAVHSLPVSCFPIERALFNTAVATAAGRVQDLSLRDIIAIVNDRFVSFPADRAYMMSNFYNAGKALKGEAELEKLTISLERSKVDQNIAAIDQKIANATAERANPATVPSRIQALDSTIAELTGIKTTLASIKTNGYKIEPNYEKTRDERLKSVGINDGKFVQPNVQIEVEACPMLDSQNNELLEKTLLKIHVYDAASDPFSTLGEILAATRDDQLNVVRIAASEFNQKVASPGGVSNSQVTDLKTLLTAAAGPGGDKILQQINVPGNGNDAPYFKVKGTYDDIKGLVSAGMPYVIYGSQNSAITTANLQSNNNAGLGNVMLQRAFNAAGDYDPAAVDSGVPMQIVPSQLSISTVGCPLFFPMQRIFFDFGTGTTADNVYFVTQIDHTIGNDGFKTEVKMSYGQGFATYTSLAQNLAAALVAINDSTAQQGREKVIVQDEEITLEAAAERSEKNEKMDARKALREARAAIASLKSALTIPRDLVAQAQLQLQWKVDAVKAAAIREAQSRVDAAIDPEIQSRVSEATLATQRAAEVVTETAAGVQNTVAAVQSLQVKIEALTSADPKLAALFVAQEAAVALAS